MLRSIDTSNAALAVRYDEIPYEALPHPATHPGRLATVGMLLGRGEGRVDGWCKRRATRQIRRRRTSSTVAS